MMLNLQYMYVHIYVYICPFGKSYGYLVVEGIGRRGDWETGSTETGKICAKVRRPPQVN